MLGVLVYITNQQRMSLVGELGDRKDEWGISMYKLLSRPYRLEDKPSLLLLLQQLLLPLVADKAAW